jgi:phosphoribosylaminoimidazole-succinocarboxamide synthase
MTGTRRLLAEGKTKQVFSGDTPNTCIFKMKDAVTMRDDPDETMIIPGKGTWSNETTCRMFEVLKQRGIPVAYIEQTGPDELEAFLCKMVALEVVARRVVVKGSSYAKRMPGTEGKRFDDPEIEFYLKTSGGMLQLRDGTKIKVDVPMVQKKKGPGPLDDPLIINPDDHTWKLLHPHLPLGSAESDLHLEIHSDPVLQYGVGPHQLGNLTREAFLILEDAWARHDCELQDIKFEFGVAYDGTQYLADVVDADSWRMLDPGREQMSKQVARDGGSHPEIVAKYRQAAEMAARVYATALAN